MDRRSRDAIALRQLSQALTVLTIAKDGAAVEVQRLTPDVPTFEAGSAHAGADSLDDQVALQFRDRSDDHHDSPAQRTAGVDLFAERDELDAEVVELIEDLEEVAGGAGDSIEGPDHEHIEAAMAGVAHQLVKTGAARLRAGDAVAVFLDDLEAALGGELVKIQGLSLRVLIDG